VIDRKRVRELREARPGGNAGAAREVGELPWVEPATHLLRMWQAPTLEESDRLAEGFPAAFRRLRSVVRTRRRDPEKHGGCYVTDPNLQVALEQLYAAAMGAYCGDPCADRGASERRAERVRRFCEWFHRLAIAPRYRPK
jgi:hypothetical protein